MYHLDNQLFVLPLRFWTHFTLQAKHTLNTLYETKCLIPSMLLSFMCTQVSAGWHSTYEDSLTIHIVFMFILITNQLFVVCYIIIHSGDTKEMLYILPYSILQSVMVIIIYLILISVRLSLNLIPRESHT